MGAPGGAYFCENGHLVYSVYHHQVDYDDSIKTCHICLSTNIKFDWEHGDSDYGYVVPTKPINVIEGHECNICKLYHGEIWIYDVSKLFDKEWIESLRPEKCKCEQYKTHGSKLPVIKGNADDGFEWRCYCIFN